MTELKAGQVLEREHEVIQHVVAAVPVIADRAEKDGRADQKLMSDIRDFLQEYADHLHHSKEEQHLFPLLERRGVPASGCPLAALRHEHQLSRALLSELTGVIQANTGQVDPLTSILGRLVTLYVDHMWKEDYLLLPMTSKVISAEDDATLLRAFEVVDASFGANKRAALERFAAELHRQIINSAETREAPNA